MGPQNTSTQIEPFLFAAYNGWGSGCLTSPTRTTVGNNLGAFRVIQFQNKCSDPKSTLGRAIPFREKYLELGHMKGQLYFFLQVNNKVGTRVLLFFFCKKIKKKGFFFGNKFSDVIKIQKFDSCQNKKMCFQFLKKNSFSFYFFLEVG